MKTLSLITLILITYNLYLYLKIKSIKKSKYQNMEIIYQLYIKKFNNLINFINKEDFNINIDIILEIHTVSNFEYKNKNYNLYFKQQNKIYDIVNELINDEQKKNLDEIQNEINIYKNKQSEYSMIEDSYKNKLIYKYIN